MYHLRIDGKIKKSHTSQRVIQAMWDMLTNALVVDCGYAMHVCSDPNAVLLKSPQGKVIGVSYDSKVRDHGVYRQDSEIIIDDNTLTLDNTNFSEYELIDNDYYTRIDDYLAATATH